MSTISLSYPDVIRVRRAPAIGRTLILSSLALIAITTLVMVISATVDLTGQAAVSESSIVPVAIPVPTLSITESQPVPSETPTPYVGETRQPSVVPVPVPTPQSQ